MLHKWALLESACRSELEKLKQMLAYLYEALKH